MIGWALWDFLVFKVTLGMTELEHLLEVSGAIKVLAS